MLTQPCPVGYYTAPGASSLEDAFLCPASRYCSKGTSASKVFQNECLPGYFCPLGTAASLSLDGTFGPGVHMVDRKKLIGLIRALLTRQEAWLKANPVERQLARLASQKKELAALRQGDTTKDKEKEKTRKRMTAKEKEAERVATAAAIERLETKSKATRWAIDSWNATKRHTEARA
jgi:hypothetical protein